MSSKLLFRIVWTGIAACLSRLDPDAEGNGLMPGRTLCDGLCGISRAFVSESNDLSTIFAWRLPVMYVRLIGQLIESTCRQLISAPLISTRISIRRQVPTS